MVPGTDHIVKPPAPDIRQPQAGDALQGAVQHPAHNLVGRGPALVNLGPGVAAQQPLQGEDIARLPGQLLPLPRQEAVQHQAASTGNGENPLLFRVQVYQLPALQIRAFQGKGPLQAHLLVHGKHRLQRRMGQAAVRQDRQNHRHGNAIVPAQGGPVRPNPLPVGAKVQALLCHVFGAVLRLHADHVDVPLENNGGGILTAGAGVLPDYHVVQLILPPLEAQLLGKAHAEVADLLCVPTAVGHGAQLFKIRKYCLWLQTG